MNTIDPTTATDVWVVISQDGADFMWWWTLDGALADFDAQAAKDVGRVRLMRLTPLPGASERATIAMIAAALPLLATTCKAMKDTATQEDRP